MNPVEQAHANLKNVLLNGRILLNGMPLTANEISGLLQGEQLLFENAIQFGKAKAIADAKKAKENPPQKPKNKKG